MENVDILFIYAASLAMELLPEPPTPTRKAFPLCWRRILAILAKWDMQSEKKMMFICEVFPCRL
jgi:hypothetical protein